MIEVLVAYTLYIIIMAIPFLVIAAIAAIFLAGIAATVSGTSGGRSIKTLLGVIMIVASSSAATMITYWATTPPADAGATTPHTIVYKTYQEMRAYFQALRWLHDGTFERSRGKQESPDGQ
jgi:glucan phosphoethanolaminetransferase (alkaline phosphatase superfamily)